jgi:DNA-binding CsgD family transcriptional regulator
VIEHSPLQAAQTATGNLAVLCSPIREIGSSRFARALLEATTEIAKTSHLTVLKGVGSGQPEMMLSASWGFDDRASEAGQHYLDRHWEKDPLRMFEQADQINDQRLFLLDSSQIRDGSYRQDCYRAMGVLQRLSLLVPTPGHILQLNLFRLGKAGPFRESELQALSALAPYFASLLVRHGRDQGTHWSKTDLEARLRGAAPILTEREINVCARILFGLTSEGIGLDLDISKNTVLTHRRRAYSKLSITSQSELFRILDDASTAGPPN